MVASVLWPLAPVASFQFTTAGSVGPGARIFIVLGLERLKLELLSQIARMPERQVAR